VQERLTFTHGTVLLTDGAAGRAEVTDRAVAAAAPGDARVVRADPAFWAASAFTLLLFIRPQDTVEPLGALHLSEAAAGIGIAAMIASRLRRGLLPVPLTREVVAVAALALVMVATAPFSIWPGGALATVTDLFLKVLLVFVLLCHALSSPERLRGLVWIILVSMAYVALRGLFDYARGVNLLAGGRLHGAVGGPMGNPNDLAMTMVTFLPLALLMAVSPVRWPARALAGGIGLVMIATVVLTKSRAGLLGLAVVIPLVVLQAGRWRGLVAMVLVAGILVGTPLMPAEFWRRASSIVDQEEDETGSREARKMLMLEGWHTFLERPFTGVGAGQFKNYNPPDRVEPWRETHNVVLQILVELGVLGGLVLTYLLCRAAVSIARTRRLLSRDGRGTAPPAFRSEERERLRVHMAAVTAGFAGWFTCAQFSSAGYYWTFYYLLALIVAAEAVVEARVVRRWPTPAGPAVAVRGPA
jgi:O-antigen ligase